METRIWRHFDLSLMLVTLVLCAFGLAMVYSATLDTKGGSLIYRQLIFVVVGLIGLGIIASTDYHILGSFAWFFYGGSVGLLALVLLIGRITHGSQRWIPLGFFELQPSEPAKIALIIVLAKYFSSRIDRLNSPRVIATSAAMMAVPFALTYIQPDLGTAMVYAAIWLGMIVVAGLRPFFLGLGAVAVAIAIPIVYRILPEYQRSRVDIFLDPNQDPYGAGYNVIQALISVGSGGLVGRGYTTGTQSQLHFLRVQYADFIFSVLAEELGFIGAVFLIGLFVFLLFRGFRAASIAWDTFGRLTCVGVVCMLAFQSLVNIGMNTGLLPVTGVPLPLISYGGSSAVTVLASIGLIQSVRMRHKRFEF